MNQLPLEPVIVFYLYFYWKNGISVETVWLESDFMYKYTQCFRKVADKLNEKEFIGVTEIYSIMVTYIRNFNVKLK